MNDTVGIIIATVGVVIAAAVSLYVGRLGNKTSKESNAIDKQDSTVNGLQTLLDETRKTATETVRQHEERFRAIERDVARLTTEKEKQAEQIGKLQDKDRTNTLRITSLERELAADIHIGNLTRVIVDNNLIPPAPPPDYNRTDH